MNKLAYAALVNKFLFLNVDSNKFNVYRGPQKSPTFLSAITLLLFFITPKAAHNRHEKQHNPKRKGKNIHKHTKIIKHDRPIYQPRYVVFSRPY